VDGLWKNATRTGLISITSLCGGSEGMEMRVAEFEELQEAVI
jgi:hypothetical protein